MSEIPMDDPRLDLWEQVDTAAKEWLEARHTPEWYIGNASAAEWLEAYQAVDPDGSLSGWK